MHLLFIKTKTIVSDPLEKLENSELTSEISSLNETVGFILPVGGLSWDSSLPR